MRKQTKLVAVLSAAALLAIGASMTSFAATGWAEENGTWVYYDKDGDRVTEEWKKSGNLYFWLDENGEMATNTIVEDDDAKYYVDVNGARVTNQWVATENDDDWEEVETVWYYFGANGKAFEGKKTINGKTYIFDEGGYMFSGWKDYEVNGSMKTFYLGDENEGWAYTGWQLLEPNEDIADEYDDEEWFNFKGNGQMRKSGRSYLNGAYYEFDENGVMVSGWVPPVATDPNAAYYTEDGNQPKGWVYAYAQGDEDEEGDQEWYYLDSKGHAFNAGATATASSAQKYVEGNADGSAKASVAAKYIKSKTYVFDNTGIMLNGVYYLKDVYRVGGSTGKMDDGYYYFNKNDGSVKGQMVTGKTTVTYDGENYYYYFSSTGKAYTNAIVDGCLYGDNGVRIDSDEGNMVYVVEDDIYDKAGKNILVNAGEEVVVSASGKVKKSGTVTIDGEKYTVKDYVIQ